MESAALQELRSSVEDADSSWPPSREYTGDCFLFLFWGYLLVSPLGRVQPEVRE